MVSRRDAETPSPFVILNLVQDNGSVTACQADERLHPVMLKQVQYDEVGRPGTHAPLCVREQASHPIPIIFPAARHPTVPIRRGPS